MYYNIIIAVLIILLFFSGAGCIYMIKKQGALKRSLQSANNRKRVTNRIISRLKNDPDFLEKKLNERNYKKVAIYGNNEFTELVIDLLKGSGIEVSYVVTGEWSVSVKDVKLVKNCESDVDATIVVSDNKKEEIEGKYKGEYLSFYDLLYDKI